MKGKNYLYTDPRGVGTLVGVSGFISGQGERKGRMEEKLERTPGNMASRIRTLQNLQMSSRLRKKRSANVFQSEIRAG